MVETLSQSPELIEFDNELRHEPRFAIPLRPKPHVSLEVIPAAVPIVIGLISLVVGITGTGIGIANLVNGISAKGRMAKLQGDVDALMRGQKDILVELASLRGEIEWAQILTLIAQPVLEIKYFTDEMNRFIPPLDWNQEQIDSWRKENQEEFKKWADAVWEDKGGLRQPLSFINSAFLGEGGLTRPLMEVLIAKAKLKGFRTQSEYYTICLQYRAIKYYEAQALAALTCAYMIKHPGATEQQAKDHVKPYQEVFENQIADTLPLLEPLKRFWTKSSTNITQPAPINWDKWKTVYGDRNKVSSSDGCVLVGLKFYQRGNRLALGITQAELDKAGEPNAATKRQTTTQEPWGSDYFQIGANTEIQLMTTVVPDQCMATGAQLWHEGNKLMVLLEYVPFNFDTRTADFTKRAWTRPADAEPSPSKWFSSDPDGTVSDESVRGRVGTLYDVLPDPLSPITGCMLDTTTADTGYMLIRVKTDFYGPDEPTAGA